MKFPTLRLLVYLRQIARELERANDLTERQLDLSHTDWRRLTGHPAKLVHHSVPTVELWNKAYSDRHPTPPEEDEL